MNHALKLRLAQKAADGALTALKALTALYVEDDTDITDEFRDLARKLETRTLEYLRKCERLGS